MVAAARSPGAADVCSTVDGRYALQRHIGSGGMGEVWEALHRFTGRRVALKRLHPALLRTDPDSVQRFFDEASLQASIRHPGVVEVLDAGREADGSAYLVLELLEGEDLESVLRRGRVLPRDLVRVATQLLDALSACHAVGVLHLDVKPSNVFLARSLVRATEVKLLDFGVARKREERGAPAFGTLEFMSPEQARGEAVDARADLFAVAAILFRGLTGTTPYPCTRLDELVQACRRPPPGVAAMRPDVPEDLAEVIDRGLAPRRSRWASAEDMAQALILCDHRQLADMPVRPAGCAEEETTRKTPPVAGADEATYRIPRARRNAARA